MPLLHMVYFSNTTRAVPQLGYDHDWHQHVQWRVRSAPSATDVIVLKALWIRHDCAEITVQTKLPLYFNPTLLSVC